MVELWTFSSISSSHSFSELVVVVSGSPYLEELVTVGWSFVYSRASMNVVNLVEEIQKMFDCEQGEYMSYTRIPPVFEGYDDPVPIEQRHSYYTFALVGDNEDKLCHRFLVDFIQWFEFTGGSRRSAKPKLFWRYDHKIAAEKYSRNKIMVRTRINIPDLDRPPALASWLRSFTWKEEGAETKVYV